MVTRVRCRTLAPRCGAVRLIAVGLALCLAGVDMGARELSRAELTEIFQRDRVGPVALSPDGMRVAYAVRNKTGIEVSIRPVDYIGAPVGFDASPEPWGMTGLLLAVTELHWVGSDWVVFMTMRREPNGQLRRALHAADVGRQWSQVLEDEAKLDVKVLVGDFDMSIPGGGGPTVGFADQSADPAMQNGFLEIAAERSALNQALLGMNTNEAVGTKPVGGATEFRYSRELRLVGLDAQSPTGVVIEVFAPPAVETEVFRVDVRTQARVNAGKFPGGVRYLYDGSAVPRIAEAPATLAMPRSTYKLRVDGEKVSWTPLDAAATGDRNAGFTFVSDELFGARSFPLCFDADPNVLVYASNVTGLYYRLWCWNLATGSRTPLDADLGAVDFAGPADAFTPRTLVRDRDGRVLGVRVPGVLPSTRWFDPRLDVIQRQVDRYFAGRPAAIVDWDDARTRALVLVSGPWEPGRYFIFHTGLAPRCVEILRRSGSFEAATLARAVPLDFVSEAGVRVVGTVTFPLGPRVTPPPLIVRCRDIPGPGLLDFGFDRDNQALAALGFMVLDVEYRGRGGQGSGHRDAVMSGIDHGPLADIRAAMAWVRGRYPFDRRRVALLGEGVGGFIAVRALASSEGEFRAAVVIDAPADLADWAHSGGGLLDLLSNPDRRLMAVWRRAFFTRPGSELWTLPAIRAGETVQQPILVVGVTGRARTAPIAQGPRLRALLQSHGAPVESLTVPAEFEAGDPDARASAFGKIAAFLNANLFGYRVEVGKERTVP